MLFNTGNPCNPVRRNAWNRGICQFVFECQSSSAASSRECDEWQPSRKPGKTYRSNSIIFATAVITKPKAWKWKPTCIIFERSLPLFFYKSCAPHTYTQHRRLCQSLSVCCRRLSLLSWTQLEEGPSSLEFTNPTTFWHLRYYVECGRWFVFYAAFEVNHKVIVALRHW